MEVFYNGLWGTVCDDDWSATDADVVCRELGFGEASQTPSATFYGSANDLGIILDNLNCDGTEQTLLDCQHEGLWNHDCSHFEDAGVVCGKSVVTALSTKPTFGDGKNVTCQ